LSTGGPASGMQPAARRRPGHAPDIVEKQAGAKTSKHVTNTCISPRKLIKGSPNPIIAMSQRLESYYSKVDVWNPIITKRDVYYSKFLS
jgi:hypothetical protein